MTFFPLIWKNKVGSLEGMVKGRSVFGTQGAGRVGNCHLQNAFEHVFQKPQFIHNIEAL